MQAITAFNNLDSAAAIELLTACLAVPTWAEQIVGHELRYKAYQLVTFICSIAAPVGLLDQQEQLAQ